MLIDPWATHSFITSGFATSLDKELDRLPEVLVISADSYTAEHVYKHCEVKIRGHQFTIYLIPLEMDDFDAGMDWLDLFQAQVDCGAKEVKLLRQDAEPVVFKGNRRVTPLCLVSYTEARRLIADFTASWRVLPKPRRIPLFESVRGSRRIPGCPLFLGISSLRLSWYLVLAQNQRPPDLLLFFFFLSSLRVGGCSPLDLGSGGKGGISKLGEPTGNC